MKRQRIVNGLGSALMFSMSLAMAWLMVKLLGFDWNRALLVQILWLVALNRWHQPSHDAEIDRARE